MYSPHISFSNTKRGGGQLAEADLQGERALNKQVVLGHFSSLPDHSMLKEAERNYGEQTRNCTLL